MIDTIRPHVSAQIWAMIQVQLLSGCRPDEVVRLRPVDIDMSGDVWVGHHLCIGAIGAEHQLPAGDDDRHVLAEPEPG